jgi:hypothetical protein
MAPVYLSSPGICYRGRRESKSVKEGEMKERILGGERKLGVLGRF